MIIKQHSKLPFFLSCILLYTCCIVACKKETKLQPDKSPAALMEGTFTGNGQYLPKGIFLGSFPSCTMVSYQDLIQSGTTTLLITATSDSIISMQFSSSSFPPITTGAQVRKNGNTISFENYIRSGRLYHMGTYNLTNQSFIFSGIVSVAFSSGGTLDCYLQFPYISGINLTPSGGGYVYNTFEHLDFTGTKQ